MQNLYWWVTAPEAPWGLEFLFRVAGASLPPLEMAKPEPDLYERIVSYFRAIIQLLPVPSLPWVGLIILATYILISVLRHVFAGLMLRASLRVRGFTPESLITGSNFMPGVLPECQVEILDAGILSDKFVGYGVRVEDTLVVPIHVIERVDNLILRGKKSSACVPKVYQSSLIVTDLAYLPLDASVWAELGTAKARISGDEAYTVLHCIGRDGKSMGMARRSTLLGMLVYEGSTLPGMSGAAYFRGQSVVGIHNGVINGQNTGYSIVVAAFEIKRMMQGESKKNNTIVMEREVKSKVKYSPTGEKGSKDDAKEKLAKKTGPVSWKNTDLARLVKKAYDDPDLARVHQGGYLANSWELDEEEAAEEKFDPSNLLDELTPEQVTALKTFLNRTGNTVSVNVGTGHSPEEPLVDFGKNVVEVRLDNLEKQVDALEARLEKMTSKKSSKPRKLECGMCARKFASELGLMAHMNFKHDVSAAKYLKGESAKVPKTRFSKKPAVEKPVLESAFKADFSTDVEQQDSADAFLGKASGTTSGPPSRQSSSTLTVSSTPCQSKEESLSETLESLKTLIGILSTQLQNTAGQNSAKTPSCGH